MMAREEMMRHFMFHKGIADIEEDTTRIDAYLHLLNSVEDGRYSQMENQMDRTASTVLELVIDEGMNPWDIDLARFAKAYRSHIKKSDFVDFIAAGRISLLAWSVLAEKAYKLKFRAEEPVEVMEEFMFDMDTAPWELFAPEDPYENVTQHILESPPIEQTVCHEERRKVGLIDLMDAFEEARREAELMEEISRVRQRLRVRQKRPDISEKLHKENLQEDISMVWRALSGINKDTITMKDMFIRDRDDFVTVFVALLFLAKEGKIELSQKRFPRGEITIKVMAPFEERVSLVEMENLQEEAHRPAIKERNQEREEPLVEEMLMAAA
ncbi:MAG: segregation/condensation protein A [Candidatus Thermoplasmatota archaeon]|nr:segregation/condensation protein A [Candidatus Thermoplasmatota archaeon]